MLTLARNDVTSQLQPRHSHRRQRQPGARERHSSMKRRFGPASNISRPTTPSPVTSQMHSTYCMASATRYAKQPEVDTAHESNHVISAMKDLSTIEAIRESMKSTEKRQTVSEKKLIPDWMLDLDMNLDVSSVDIIPPFEQTQPSAYDDVTFNEQPTVTFIYDEDEDVELYGEYPALYSSNEHTSHERTNPSPEPPLKREATLSVSPRMSSPMSFRATTASPDGRRSRGSHISHSSPRRYQGDKKVMSMQQGGIRSTPMQPTSKKFINQMLTFTQVKVHDKKIKKAKPAIDTKMPSTFKIALDRKKLVEERSFKMSFQSSTPVGRSSTKSSTSKQSKEEKSR